MLPAGLGVPTGPPGGQPPRSCEGPSKIVPPLPAVLQEQPPRLGREEPVLCLVVASSPSSKGLHGPDHRA